MITTSESVKAITTDLLAAQKAYGPVVKNKVNPHLRNHYADLGSCFDAVIPALNANGIMLMQSCGKAELGICVTTRLIHKSGEWIDFGETILPVDKATAQAVGSALTYAKRYSLTAALCLFAEDDDDGAGASKQKPNGSDAAAALKAKRAGGDDDLL
jgi:hypothetical protein